MNDLDLMELAAKAAGYKIEWVRNSGCFYRCEEEIGREEWNPLDDDGDAFRLAIKLGICIQLIPQFDTAQVYQERESTGEPFNIHVSALGDIELRRIITQAAAEIGKSMP